MGLVRPAEMDHLIQSGTQDRHKLRFGVSIGGVEGRSEPSHALPGTIETLSARR